jgi:hypothetical protein
MLKRIRLDLRRKKEESIYADSTSFRYHIPSYFINGTSISFEIGGSFAKHIPPEPSDAIKIEVYKHQEGKVYLPLKRNGKYGDLRLISDFFDRRLSEKPWVKDADSEKMRELKLACDYNKLEDSTYRKFNDCESELHHIISKDEPLSIGLNPHFKTNLIFIAKIMHVHIIYIVGTNRYAAGINHLFDNQVTSFSEKKNILKRCNEIINSFREQIDPSRHTHIHFIKRLEKELSEKSIFGTSAK